MNTRTIKASLALLSLLPYFAHAQGGPPPLPAPPPPSPNDTLVSPSVGNDGRVTIQIYAPKADEVRLTGDWMSGRPEPIRLEQDARGVWSATVGPLAPDYYSYTLTVDGVRTLDPKNPMIKQGNESVDNLFLVPGEAIAYAMNQRVPHGTIRQIWYYSETLGQERRMHVYTPPGYEESGVEYPVLYLLHGGGDEDSGWSTIGRAGQILDNLLAKGDAEPMLVVMPNGSLPPGPPTDDPLPDGLRTAALERFSRELMEGIVPYVEEHFRVRAVPAGRAIAGLSMGGGQTMHVLEEHADSFGYVSIWSAGLFRQPPADYIAANDEFLANPQRVNDNVALLSIVVGDDDFALPGAQALAKVYADHGIEHEFELTGGGHTWRNWRAYLHALAPRLFR